MKKMKKIASKPTVYFIEIPLSILMFVGPLMIQNQ